MAVTIAVESPLGDDVRTLIAALNAYLLEHTPPQFCSHMTVEQMAQPDTTVFVARDENGRALACGALRRHGGGVGEVKRMYTVPAEQGQGIGGRILEQIEGLARGEGLTRLVLETGHVHHDAYRVYERGGFRRCGPVLDYPDTGWSVFYEKPLASTAPRRAFPRSPFLILELLDGIPGALEGAQGGAEQERGDLGTPLDEL